MSDNSETAVQIQGDKHTHKISTRENDHTPRNLSKQIAATHLLVVQNKHIKCAIHCPTRGSTLNWCTLNAKRSQVGVLDP